MSGHNVELILDKVYKGCRERPSSGALLELSPAPALTTDPEVRPTPIAALAFDRLPTGLHFVRSHFGVPTVDPAGWILEVGGAVRRPRRYPLSKLRQRQARTQEVVLECAGHRRDEFRPIATGLQWGVGAISEARWTGVPLSEVLEEVSPTDGACEVLFEGCDRGPHRNSSSVVSFARSIPLDRALAGDVLLAWRMNGQPIPPIHGAPLGVIVPGSYGVASIKWLRRITVLEQAFVGPFQTDDYQLNGRSLQELKVNSLIVEPADGDLLPAGAVKVCGAAWSGRDGIASVEIRLVGGQWQQAVLNVPRQPTALHHWSANRRAVCRRAPCRGAST